MAADSAGNDIAAVGLPITGAMALAPINTTLPTPEELADPELALAAAFKKLGLYTEDGAPEWTMEPDGDPIKFFQFGYSIPSGLATCEVTVTLAQSDATVRGLLYGKTPDPETGFYTIDAGGHAIKYVLYEEVIFKNGQIRRRVAGSAGVKSVKEVKATGGEPFAYETTFTIERFAGLNNEHIGECWLAAA